MNYIQLWLFASHCLIHIWIGMLRLIMAPTLPSPEVRHWTLLSFDARVRVPTLNTPLSVQLNWFRTNLNSICHTPAGCERRLRRALVLVGEIGGNDINYALVQGKSIKEIQSYVPFIVGVTIDAVREVIRLGAVRVVVPGKFPIGCLPLYLTAFSSRDPGAYDDLGCLSSLNELAVFQNNYLKEALDSLRPEFPLVVILYSDHFAAFQSVLRRAAFLSFDQKTLLRACCGTGEQYNFDLNRMCGSQGVPVCPNPAQYIHWDGRHLTEEAYRRISEILILKISNLKSSAFGRLGLQESSQSDT